LGAQVTKVELQKSAKRYFFQPPPSALAGLNQHQQQARALQIEAQIADFQLRLKALYLVLGRLVRPFWLRYLIVDAPSDQPSSPPAKCLRFTRDQIRAFIALLTPFSEFLQSSASSQSLFISFPRASII
jgi:hypothetical protein